MAITLKERSESRPVQYGATTGQELLKYWARGSDDEVAVYDHVVASTPPVLNGLVRRDIRLTPMGDDDKWDVEVEYGRTGQDGTGDALGSAPTDPASDAPTVPGTDGETASTTPLGAGYNFDLSAETIHITSSLKNLACVARGDAEFFGSDLVSDLSVPGRPAISSAGRPALGDDVGRAVFVHAGSPAGWRPGPYKITAVSGGLWEIDRPAARAGAAGGATWSMLPQAPDMGGAIGKTADRIEGCDVFAPRFEWSRTVTRSTVTRAYMLQLRDLVGKKNKAPFYGSKAGEVVYLGASGTFSVSDRWSITHKFAEIANRIDVEVVPDELVIPYKRGWDHLWVSYREEESEVAPDEHRLVTKVDGAYIEDVIEDGDFDLIGIGR